MLKRIQETSRYLLDKTNGFKPDFGIVLGTGLGGLVNEIDIKFSINYSEIPNFPVSTVKGHKGRMIFGQLSGKSVIALQGRFHYYEGYSMKEVTFPIRVLNELGIKILILSNASGGLNPDFQVGDVMFIEDHINLMGTNPLIGPNDEKLGPRFPDMSQPYDHALRNKACEIAAKLGLEYRTGVYVGVTGPTFETPAEYKYVRFIGGDAVGMSTVPEVIVARQANLPCLAFSVISDLGVEGKIVEISHEDVIDAASIAEPKMTRIIKAFISGMD
ncbi:MAG TPA: purine-nucleoside phosphorylase [Bacteroidales bacterium]|nr:purine-nucleoside phosphorylase [Bacteroidales bacterium]